jgi:predicted transcriptional regulator
MEISSLADEFLEISSGQRLSLIVSLYEKKNTLSGLAKTLDATAAEVHRNLGRLEKVGLVQKDPDGYYFLTTYGKTMHAQIPTLQFMVQNKKYFENHDFGELAQKYIQRIGALAETEFVVGYSKVMEKWENIYKNSQKYIYNVLVDIPYNEEILDILQVKLEKKTHVFSIFSETASVPDERQKLLDKYDFSRFIKDEILKRKMIKSQKISLVLNEKEAGISFPSQNEPDMSKMFYGSSDSFHQWCRDLFMDLWGSASSFQESKLKQ